MPGAGYAITCTECQLPSDAFATAPAPGALDDDWPATLDEFFGERGGHECRYCPECGYVGELRHFFKLFCDDCGRRERTFADMSTAPDQCACGGARSVQLIHGRTPKCPDHPGVDLLGMSLIELQGIDDGMTSIPCRLCKSGVLVIGHELLLMD